jgi:transposase
MAQNFIGCDRDQSFLMPPDVRDWLPEDHFAWFVLDAVAGMNLRSFYDAYRRDGVGRRAYDPAMLVALLLYCYARGMRSSRRIERACLDDVACRVIAMLEHPDHATIARFVERHEQALGELFGQVLALCAQAGLAAPTVVAIDGTKIDANANRHAVMDYEQIAQEIIEDARTIDAAEDELYGDARGDELPPELATRAGRRGWLRDAQRRLDEQRAEQAKPIPGPRQARLREARRRLEEQLAVQKRANAAFERQRAEARDALGRRYGGNVKPLTLPDTPTDKINTTDLDSRLQKTALGWLQGYNAQAAANQHQIVLAADVMVASPDFGHLEPVLAQARDQLARAGISDKPQVVVADAGYWHQEQMQRVMADGITVLVTPDGGLRKGPRRPGWDKGLYAFMRAVIASEHGEALYKRRQQIIEPVFANTKHNREIRRFLRRGRSAARTEWRLITATHNLLKLHTHHLAATPA